MAKTGYKYNRETLSYDKIEISWQDRLRKFIKRVISTLCLSTIIFMLVFTFIDSPKEKMLRREKEEILAQYNILNSEMERLNAVLTDLERRDDNIYRVVFESDPIDVNIRRAGTGGANKYEALKNMDNAEMIITTSRKLDQLSKAMYIQSKSYDEIESLAKNKIDMAASIPAILPLALADEKVRISSAYGFRMHPFYKTVKMHYGMDFSGPIGTPIYATGNGRVKTAEKSKGYGLCIEIDHGYSYSTLYAHLDKYIVKKGQRVKRGDIIGYLGNTGMSFGPHLHYEVRRSNVPQNPINFYFNDLTPDEYDRLVQIANNTGQSMD
ncbi:MAG: M23 family metallopeptidase [Marinifilaceae bacterium]